MSGFSLDLGPVKEPIGFIKFLQWIFSIFAFATCGGYSGQTSIFLTCRNAQNITWTRDFFYPFSCQMGAAAILTRQRATIANGPRQGSLHLVSSPFARGGEAQRASSGLIPKIIPPDKIPGPGPLEAETTLAAILDGLINQEQSLQCGQHRPQLVPHLQTWHHFVGYACVGYHHKGDFAASVEPHAA
ncbi:hypothetical protein Chor_005432 [Crotalus horridus]